jgi:hypothetical protein
VVSNGEMNRAQQALADPRVGVATLWDIARRYPELRVFVALNSKTPQDLLDWLDGQDDPRLRQAVAERRAPGWRPEPRRIFGIPLGGGSWLGR